MESYEAIRVLSTTKTNRLPSRWFIASLGIAQIISWGSLFYANGVLMNPMRITLHLAPSTLVGAYSCALLISGILSTFTGRIIDRIGGRLVMAGGSLLSAISLVALAKASDVLMLYLAWIGIGVGMSATLYQPAFVVITQIFKEQYRQAITFLTLFGGFASTVFWPLTQFLYDHFGWSNTWLTYAGLHVLVCLPIHLIIPAYEPHRPQMLSNSNEEETHPGITLYALLRTLPFYLFTLAVTFNALVFSAMSLYLISILQARGFPATQAAWIGALIGPMQVLGRVLEISFGKNYTSQQVGLLALILLPIALSLLFAPAAWLIIYLAFAIGYGIGNGVMTIVRGTLPAELYGRHAYGEISGAMMTPVMIAIAAGPMIASVLYEISQSYNSVLLALITVAVAATLAFVFAARSKKQSLPMAAG